MGEVTGMQNRPDFNGKMGKITDFDESKGRYHVSLGGQMAALQPGNLILSKGVRARVVGLTNGAQYNSRVGKVLDFDREAGRYLLQLSQDQQLKVKLENLML